MENNLLLNALALASKSKTNKKVAMWAGIGIFALGVIWINSIRKNKVLSDTNNNYLKQISDLNNKINSAQAINNSLEDKLNKSIENNNAINAEFQKLKSSKEGGESSV